MRRFKIWVAGGSTRKGERRLDMAQLTPATQLDQWAREHSCPTCSAVDAA